MADANKDSNTSLAETNSVSLHSIFSCLFFRRGRACLSHRRRNRQFDGRRVSARCSARSLPIFWFKSMARGENSKSIDARRRPGFPFSSRASSPSSEPRSHPWPSQPTSISSSLPAFCRPVTFGNQEKTFQGLAYSADFAALGSIVMRWAPLPQTGFFIGVLSSFSPVSFLVVSPTAGWVSEKGEGNSANPSLNTNKGIPHSQATLWSSIEDP